MIKIVLSSIFMVGLLTQTPVAIAAENIAQFKKVEGAVFVERDGKRSTAQIGGHVQQHDVVITGGDGSAGLTFADNSLLSLGPNSILSLDRFEFNATTHEGKFDTSLKKGVLSVVSGRIVKQKPEAMTIRTPSAILGARGTEFVIKAE